MRLFGVSVCGLEINGKPYGLIVCFDERNVRIVILMLSENNFVPVGLSKSENFRKEVYLKNLLHDLCVRRDRVNILEDVDKSFDRPLTIATADVIS